MRRARVSQSIRELLSDVSVDARKLIMPVFVDEGLNGKREIGSMPGIFRYGIDALPDHLDELQHAGLKNIILFGIPKGKDSGGSSSYLRDGIVQRSIRIARENFSLNVIADLCLCEYTDTGQCGIIRDGYVDNDATLSVYDRIAASYADAGVDVVAPSGMMDGQVGSIRRALDKSGHENVMIMGYSNKYASTLYAPFRDAADSAPRVGDRKSYQMDYRRKKEYLMETSLDIEEGADIIMVKPAIFYLDIVKSVSDHFPKPLAVYSVSGEYSMIRHALDLGILPHETVGEYITSIFRAGANLVITYFALEIAGKGGA